MTLSRVTMRLHALRRALRRAAVVDALKCALWSVYLTMCSALVGAIARAREREGEEAARRRRARWAGRIRRTRAREALAPRASAREAPTHLVACLHGLAGTPEDLRAMARRMEAHPGVLARRVECNAPLNSFDGVEEGARRVVEELRAVVKANPSLRYLTLYGNSLGGIYARYAAALMWAESRDGTMLGLRPCTFLTTATPHLGVGCYGFFRLVPRAAQDLWARKLGRSIMELSMRDDEDGQRPLLARMADPSVRDPLDFVGALGAFERRCAYANATNDFLVSYETASISPELLDAAVEREWRSMEAPQIVEEFVVEGVPMEHSPVTEKRGDELDVRRRMARGLRTLTWKHVNVAFPGGVPLAHNKICALQRSEFLEKLFKEGEFIVDHQAEYLLEPIRRRYKENGSG